MAENAVAKVLVLHMVDPGLITNIPYGFMNSTRSEHRMQTGTSPKICQAYLPNSNNNNKIVIKIKLLNISGYFA